MRDWAKEFLGDRISRRAFIRRSATAGFSLAAAESAANALAPLVSSVQRAAVTGASAFVGTGGELLAEQLRAFGTHFVFVCNSSGMGALCDALVDRPDMQFIQAVSENQVVGIADGYAKATGRASFACFSRVGGPLASANMYNAMKDRTPVVIFADHADTHADGRDGHEDLDDWLEPFKQYTKWRWIAKEGARIPEWIAHAFKISTVAPGGPTFVRVPRNVLYQKNLKAEIFSGASIATPMRLVPDPALIERAALSLIEARSPILYVGAEVWTSGARADVVELAESLAIPVTQARSWAADFPTDHPLYLGGYFHPMRFPEGIDLFLNLGAKMPDQGGGPPMVPRAARIIHARIESHQVGVNYPIDHAIVADVKETARALLDAVKAVLTAERLKTIRQARAEKIERAASALREAFRIAAREGWDASPITWPRLLLTLDEMLDDDAIIVEEVGTEDWVLRSFAFADGKKTKIGRTLGRSLGWGVSASIGVKLARPDQQVVALQGDGGFLFGQSDALWSMSRYDAPILLIVCNNRSYDEPRNNILMKEGRCREENKDMICYLGAPDVKFTHLASAYGIRGERVVHPGELKPALKRAIAATREGRPYLLDVLIARTGLASDSTWHPRYSLAAVRTRKV
jgi:thiamine pyrophosphate-dependent acetolactate synthase large subunit-like protein